MVIRQVVRSDLNSAFPRFIFSTHLREIALSIITAVFILISLTSTPAHSTPTKNNSPFSNMDRIADVLGFTSAGKLKPVKTVKVAILDNGFRGYQGEIGKSIPPSTIFHTGPVPIDSQSEEAHGLYMAQLLAGLLAYTPDVTYELHLFSSFGYSNFAAAVNEVIKQKFDIALYSQVWEYGGNGDGRGFINSLVTQAISSGTIWINSAGNFANGTFEKAVESSRDGWLKLPGPNDTVRIRCAAKTNEKCYLRAVLSWNDFKDDVNIGTEKDLDLILTDDTLKIIGSSALVQMVKISSDAAPGASLYPREIVQLNVEPGLYFIRVKDRSKNFNSASDKIRITVSGEAITLQDQTTGETLLAPADNPSAIVVGASDSEKSSFSKSRNKPDLFAASNIVLKTGEQFKGSSNSAAMAAAVVTVLASTGKAKKRSEVLQLLSSSQSEISSAPGRGLPLDVLGFSPLNSPCFRIAGPTFAAPFVQSQLQWLFKIGGVAVQTSMGIKIFLSEDPFSLPEFSGLYRVSPDDMLVLSPNGYEPLPRTNQLYLQQGYFEVLQTPAGQTICQVSPDGRSPRSGFRLPKGGL